MIIMMIFNMSTWYFHKIVNTTHIYAVPVTVLLVGLPKKERLNLDI
jgi:hypothetical protein